MATNLGTITNISFAVLTEAGLSNTQSSPVPIVAADSNTSNQRTASATLASVSSLWDRSEGRVSTSAVGLIAAGLFGGFLKEFFRWKKLRERKRQDLFLRPEFVILSA